MSDPPAPWRGQARMGVGWGLFAGHAGDGEPHAHHAVQVLLADKPQWVWTHSAGRGQYAGLVIGADVVHRLEPTSEPVTLLYIEPYSPAGRDLQACLSDGLHVLDDQQVRLARHAIDGTLSVAILTTFAGGIAGRNQASRPAMTHDDLMEQLIASLPAELPDRVKAANLAAEVGLSQSRFLHRFRDHTGLALRPYLRWRRLLAAMTQVLSGRSLTDAAFAAGFADAAHFTRTFRRHFGIAPRTLIGLQSPS